MWFVVQEEGGANDGGGVELHWWAEVEGELGRSEELKVANEHRGAWIDRLGGLFLGRGIFGWVVVWSLRNMLE